MSTLIVQPEVTAADDALMQTYRAEMRAMLVSRARTTWALLLTFLLIACSLGWIYFPERSLATAMLFTAASFIGLANAGLVGVFPLHATRLTVLATIALSATMCMYFALARPPAELCVMG